uniref:Uncharacterized protein n=1 Tax=uncultured prokaryote TaxID=198431 RepID=A0A0H5Q7T0_9ZZZZ|nr:hypothetical protein [uncultured prokaryote]
MLFLPPRLNSFPEDEVGRATATASVVTTLRGIPHFYPLGSAPIYVPLRPMTGTEQLRTLWEAAKLVQEP